MTDNVERQVDAVENDGAKVYALPIKHHAEPETSEHTGPTRDAVGAADASPDTHFEVELDEEPQPGGAVVDLPAGGPVVSTSEGGRRAVIPSALRGWANIKFTIRYWVGYGVHVADYHAVRSPWYALQVCWWALVGAVRLPGRQVRWWWVTEQWSLRQSVATANDPKAWLDLHQEAKATRLWRGLVLACEVPVVLFGLPWLWALLPWPAKAVAVTAAAVALARLGRPADRSIVSAAVVAGRHRRLNADIVLRAYYAAGLGHPERPNQQVAFGSTMSRDATGSGSQVVIDLPYGKGFDDAVKAKGAIASGLDVSINQVFLTRDDSSHRRHVLFVADRDPLAIPAGRTPLLNCKPRDIWQPAPLGLDERGRPVTLLLMWISVLVGAQPRKGKTFFARLLALYAALDPYVRLIVVDGKGSPDWGKFRLVAHRLISGTVPNSRDTDPVTHLLEALREIKRHIEEVNDLLAKLPVTECPEGKLTPELTRRYPTLRVWMLVMEEFQEYYELDDQDTNKEIAGLLSFIMAVGPSAGVILLAASQKPSGIGAGDVARLFNRFRDNFAVRFALRCGSRVVSEAVLGGDAYAEGFDASTLPVGNKYRGVGILYGASDDTPITRSHLADHEDAEKILTAARKHREAAGTLSGLAAGEELERETRDVLADVRSMFDAGDTGLQWEELAARLAERIPEHYADTTAESISAQLRALRIRSVDVKRSGAARKGCRKDALDAALAARETR